MDCRAAKFLALSTALIGFHCGLLLAQAQDISAIAENWTARANSIRTIQGELEYESAPSTRDDTARHQTGKHKGVRGKAAFKIDFQTGTFRIDIEQYASDNKGGVVIRAKAKSFNGKDYRSVVYPAVEGGTDVRPYGPTAADMLVVKSGFEQYPLDQMLVPIIEHCGRIGNSQDQQLYPGTFQIQRFTSLADILVPKVRNDLKSGAIFLDSFPSKTGSQSSSVTLGLMPKSPHRLLKQEIRLDRRPLLQREFRYERDELSGWHTVAYLPASSEVILDQTVRIKRVEYNVSIPDKEFTVRPAPGMILGEVTIESTPEDADDAQSESVARFQVGSDGELKRIDSDVKRSYVRPVASALVLLITLVLGVLLFGRRRHSNM